MVFRYARHCNNLDLIVNFYTRIIGLEILGNFKDHDHYNGVFLGHPHLDWHIEFTQSNHQAKHVPDKDDLLVFYVYSELELKTILNNAEKLNIKPTLSQNPYWQKNGIELQDPEGFGIIITVKDPIFNSKDPLTLMAINKGLNSWNQTISYVKTLPYGRNANRTDLSLVLTEKKGTCSSKHAFLKQLADLNGIKNIKLILGIYRMTQENTPGIGSILSDNHLQAIPEAHTYLKINGKRIDVTTKNSNFEKIQNDIIEEIEIEPHQVDSYKIKYHQDFFKNWIKEQYTDKDFATLWGIREKCIAALSE